jgi:hypothetical protein
MKPEFLRDGLSGSKWLKIKNKMPVIGELGKTHIFLKQVEAKNLEDVFHNMQAENWSPDGQANEFIQYLKLDHTSMSVGDIIIDYSQSKVFMVDSMGFEELQKKKYLDFTKLGI